VTDGNLYKMEAGTGELNNLSPLGPTDKSDLNYLLSNYTGASDAWWRTNWALTNFYSFQTTPRAPPLFPCHAPRGTRHLSPCES
jgi:hypothetical protein